MALIEASGGISLDRIRDIAATGVDIIWVGALTHSVRTLDPGLDIEPTSTPPDLSPENISTYWSMRIITRIR